VVFCFVVSIIFSSLFGVNALSLALYRINFGYDWDVDVVLPKRNEKPAQISFVRHKIQQIRGMDGFLAGATISPIKLAERPYAYIARRVRNATHANSVLCKMNQHGVVNIYQKIGVSRSKHCGLHRSTHSRRPALLPVEGLSIWVCNYTIFRSGGRFRNSACCVDRGRGNV